MADHHLHLHINMTPLGPHAHCGDNMRNWLRQDMPKVSAWSGSQDQEYVGMPLLDALCMQDSRASVRCVGFRADSGGAGR